MPAQAPRPAPRLRLRRCPVLRRLRASHARALDQRGSLLSVPDALANKVRHPRNVYLRQDAFEADVNGWLTTPVFAPHRLCDTIDQMIAGQQATGEDRKSTRLNSSHVEISYAVFCLKKKKKKKKQKL